MNVTDAVMKRKTTRYFLPDPISNDEIAELLTKASRASSGAATERFTAAAAAQGLVVVVERFPEDTRTAQQAADALGCELGQIVKSLVFAAGDELVLVLTSGVNRVDQKRAAPLFGVTKLGRADADQCRSATGFAIGGIPPCGYPEPLRSVIDEDLLQYDTIWAAAGAPDAVFALTPQDLTRPCPTRSDTRPTLSFPQATEPTDAGSTTHGRRQPCYNNTNDNSERLPSDSTFHPISCCPDHGVGRVGSHGLRVSNRRRRG